MRNIKLTIQYDGTNFSGFELQPGKRTIRGEIEKALFKLFKTRIKIISSSRTDSGVHALANIVNFHLDKPIPVSKITDALNSVLPDDIRVIGTSHESQVTSHKRAFNARYDAKSKEYEYLIYNERILPPHLKNLVWHVKPKLDLSAMKKAAKFLLGRHDFSSFCASNSDDTNFVRTLYKVSVTKHPIKIWSVHRLPTSVSPSRDPDRNIGTSSIALRIKGNGFLYKMVRNIAGTLVEVGLGKREASDIKKILKAKDRRLAGRCAPPQGLCLVKVNY